MANTPFLNLVKPTDTDQALITDINNNSDKIDTGVSTLSEQKVDKSNMLAGNYKYTSLSDLQTGFVSLASSIGANKSRLIYLDPDFTSAIFAGAPGWASIVVGRVVTYFSVLFHSYAVVVQGEYLNGTWTWQQLAMNGDIIATPSTGSSVTGHAIINGTGNIRDVPRFYIRGNLLTIFGRVVIDSFNKTGSSPGLSFTVPNSKTLDTAVNTYSGIVFDGNGLRIGENAIIQGAANGTTISIATSETYTNVVSGRFGFILNPFNVLIK